MFFLPRNLYSFYLKIAETDQLTITEASRRGVSRLVADAENGRPTIVRRHAGPVAAVISYGELQCLQALEGDLVDVALVLARSATDNGRRTRLDDVFESLGHTREQLEATDEPR